MTTFLLVVGTVIVSEVRCQVGISAPWDLVKIVWNTQTPHIWKSEHLIVTWITKGLLLF
jgi:membrane-associated PAP2 superfamily phosphatase